MVKRRPGYLTRYAEHAGITVRVAAGQLQRIGIDYHSNFDFAEADRRREEWLVAGERTEQDGDIAARPLSREQARERHFKANLAELEYKQRLNQLIDRELAEAYLFELVRKTRNLFLMLPPRMGADLARENDPQRCTELLREEIWKVLVELGGEEGCVKLNLEEKT